MTDVPTPRRATVRRLSALAWLAVVVLPFGVRALGGGEPSALVAAEVDALEGGVRIAEALTGPGDAGLRDRLKDGFRPPPGHPRLHHLMGSDEGRRLVLVPPVPRWVAALGVSGLPGPDTTPNGHRASVAAALLFALAGLLLAMHLGPWRALAVTATVLAIPDARDAASAFGYGASAWLGSALLLVGLHRTVAPRGGAPEGFARAAGTTGLVVGGLALLIGTHPFMVAAPIAAWLAVGVGRSPGAGSAGPDGLVTVPRLPAGVLLWPVAALALVALLWPALWAGTGKRLVAYVVEAGAFAADAQTVGGLTFEQVANRAPQAFTALVQLLGWTPLPILGLALVGLLRARRPDRVVLLAGLLTPLVVGAIDGGLQGARLSLWPMLWLPIGWAATLGAEAVAAQLWRARAVASAEAPWGGRVLVTAGAVALSLGLELSGADGALGTRTGRETAWPLPLALFDGVGGDPGAVEVDGGSRGFGPGLDAMRDHLERGWSVASGAPTWRLAVGGEDEAVSPGGAWRGLDLRLERVR